VGIPPSIKAYVCETQEGLPVYCSCRSSALCRWQQIWCNLSHCLQWSPFDTYPEMLGTWIVQAHKYCTQAVSRH